MLKRNSNTSNRANISKDNKQQKVFVGLSGGVDSAVSVALLKEAGFLVTGVFIKAWQADFLPCNWRTERRDAMKVAIALDIPFLFFDLGEEYKKGVIDKIVEEYRVGRTPNPDVLCNREVKFGAFWQKAKELGADFIATGHYARVEGVGSKECGVGKLATNTNLFSLLESVDNSKDQSYFLWTLTQDDLAHTLFPIGHLEKSEVRRLAKKFDLPVAEKKDSQGVCFLGDISMDEFLSHFIETKKGDVLNINGEVIGTHDGSLYYTIGERRGFDVNKKDADSKAFYVVSKDMKANTITVSNVESEISNLSPKRILLKNINWINKPIDSEPLEARIRYRGERLLVKVVENSRGIWEVGFDKPAKGLSFGQSIVFYQGKECLGGAIMDKEVIISKHE